MRGFAAAVQFLTRLPLGRWNSSEQDRRRMALWFGVVGLGIGGVLAAVEWALRPAMPLMPRLVCVLIVNAVLTGGLHLDGLADTADALGGPNAARALEIMRDSRIGSYGALALLGALGLQLSGLAQMDAAAVTRALVLGPAWGRAAMVGAAAFDWRGPQHGCAARPASAPAGPGTPCAPARAARSEGLGAGFLQNTGWREAVAAFAPVGVVAMAWGGRGGVVAGVVAVGLAAALTVGFQRRFGGHTGDTLGCVAVLVETATYVVYMVMA